MDSHRSSFDCGFLDFGMECSCAKSQDMAD